MFNSNNYFFVIITCKYLLTIRADTLCWQGGVVQRGLQREREAGDNDKHLCLVTVISVERPDKSHQELGSKGERLLRNSSYLGRLLLEQELFTICRGHPITRGSSPGKTLGLLGKRDNQEHRF